MTANTHSSTIAGHISTRISLGKLREKLKARRQARANRIGYRQLLEFDAHILRDIGLSPDDIHYAMHQSDPAKAETEINAVRSRAA